MLTHLFTALRLCLAMTSDEVPEHRACKAAIHITLTAAEYDPELVAAIAYGESRFQVDSQSEPVLKEVCDDKGCRTVTYWDCGPMQVRTSSPGRCRRLRTDPWYGYSSGVQRLRDAREFCERRNDSSLRCTVAGYQAGPAGVEIYKRSKLRTAKYLELLDRAFAYGMAPIH